LLKALSRLLRKKLVAVLKSSQTFGEMVLIDGEPRSATGIVAEESIVFFEGKISTEADRG